MSGAPLGGHWEGSVLADFDAGDLLDALSLGIIILDSQLCAIYANVMAADVFALRIEKLRGQPFAAFLPHPRPLLNAIARALEKKETVAFSLAGYRECPSDSEGALDLRVTPVRDQLIGTYVLLEVRAPRAIAIGEATRA